MPDSSLVYSRFVLKEAVLTLSPGIDLLLRLVRADKAKLFPVDLIQRFVDAGAFTYKYSILGSTAVSTADPKNIQVSQLLGENVPILDICRVV